MKFSAVLLMALMPSLLAQDTLLVGGKSPDGHCEVRIYQTASMDPSDYFYGVVDAKTGKLIKQLKEGGGLYRYKDAAKTSNVLWHSSSKFFALTDHGTRHSKELYVYEISPNDVVLIEIPNVAQNALGRVGATEGYSVSVIEPLRWDGELLKCNYVFDAYLPNRERSPQYTTEFTLKLLHGSSGQRAYLEFISMKKPEAHEG